MRYAISIRFDIETPEEVTKELEGLSATAQRARIRALGNDIRERLESNLSVFDPDIKIRIIKE